MIDSTWAAYRPNTASQYAHMKDAPTDLQDDAGLSYIRPAYGDPAAAQAHWAGGITTTTTVARCPPATPV
jgi:hypothetical protein